jgi:hypothetical protein
LNPLTENTMSKGKETRKPKKAAPPKANASNPSVKGLAAAPAKPGGKK